VPSDVGEIGVSGIHISLRSTLSDSVFVVREVDKGGVVMKVSILSWSSATGRLRGSRGLCHGVATEETDSGKLFEPPVSLLDRLVFVFPTMKGVMDDPSGDLRVLGSAISGSRNGLFGGGEGVPDGIEERKDTRESVLKGV